MSTILLGVALIVFGLASIWDALRISSTIRPRGTLDLVGPDRYLQGLAVILLLLGVGLLFKGFRDGVKREGAAPRVPAAATRSVHWLLVAILVAYTFLLDILGYPVATLIAFIAFFWVMGIRRWLVNGMASLAATASFYVLFVVFAGMDFPRGMLGLG